MQARGSSERTLLVALCYLPPLFFLPYLMPQPSKSDRFHALQAFILLVGLLLLAVVVGVTDVIFRRLLGSIVLLGWYFSLIAWLIRYPVALCVGLLYLILSAVAAANAAAGRTWRAPFAGRLAARILD